MSANVSELPGPYPGLAPFQDRKEDRLLFFGRTPETQELLNLILSARVTLLYGRSGLGKSSLLNASLMQELRERGYFPVNVRLTHDPKNGPIQSIYECVRRDAIKEGVEITVPPTSESLWAYFSTAMFTANGKALSAVLIIDQFEELFTVIRNKSREGRYWEESLVVELADLARHRVPESLREKYAAELSSLRPGDPDRKRLVALLYEGLFPETKIVISIRETFLPELESLQGRIPGILRNSLRLKPLTVAQAREAIAKPSQVEEVLGKKTFTFGHGVLDQMLTFLSTKMVGGERIEGDAIDPVQLQILCHDLARRVRKKGATEVTLSHLKGERGMKRIIQGYYRNVLRRFARLRAGWNGRRFRPSFHNILILNRPRAAIRRMCENVLITPGRHRNSVAGDVIKRQYGIRSRDLSRLVDERLLRKEARLGTEFFELSHDSLVAPLLASRRRRRIVRLLAVPAIILIPLAIPTFFSLTVGGFKYVEATRGRAPLKNPRLDAQRKSASVRQLLEEGHREFSMLDLTGIDLADEDLSNVDFKGATLRNARLVNAFLIGAHFSGADLSDALLSGSKLWGADFSDANLVGTDLRNADLSGAKFVGATLEDARLTGAELAEADFAGATVEGVDFGESNWWLAYGWTARQIEALRKKWPPQSYKTARAYHDGIELRTRSENDGDSPLERAEWLNNLAWFRAINGLELDHAQDEVNEALKLSPTHANLLDTRGFILLQRRSYSEALQDLKAAIDIQPENREIRYHLALALRYLGRSKEAAHEFDVAEAAGYRPTYELALFAQQAGSGVPEAKPD